jgi:hypothetical protein
MLIVLDNRVFLKDDSLSPLPRPDPDLRCPHCGFQEFCVSWRDLGRGRFAPQVDCWNCLRFVTLLQNEGGER